MCNKNNYSQFNHLPGFGVFYKIKTAPCTYIKKLKAECTKLKADNVFNILFNCFM
jgi:hypothetical protein